MSAPVPPVPHIPSVSPTRVLRITSVLRILSLTALGELALLLTLMRVYPYTFVFPTFPRITHTASGAAGDPLNVILVGSRQHITQSFARAGWLIPDPITPQTSARIAADSLAHRSYPTAPVSKLYVFGRPQDLAFERPTTDVQNRGHIRLWATDASIGGQPVWVGQASYDHGIELSGMTGLPTHHIAPTVDLERDAVGADLATTGLVAAEWRGAFAPPIFVAHNGGGDYYASDGDALIVSYTRTTTPATLPLATSGGLEALILDLKRAIFRAYDTLLTTPPLALAAGLLGVALLLLGVWPALRWLRQRVGVQRET
jgi:LssY-like putative type I secretion system component LssY